MNDPRLNNTGEISSLRRMGIRISKEEEDSGPEDFELFQAVVGRVKDIRDFQEEEIREWVNQMWITNGDIRVKKVSKLFFFICPDLRDRHNLVSRGMANYQGALIIFSKCEPRRPFNALVLPRVPIWIRIEGLPLLY